MSYDYQTTDPFLYALLKEFAQKNRNNPTEAESLLWQYLKADGLGATFKRQHVIGDYIVDFACIPYQLVIELDGHYHQLPDQQTSDAERTEWLEQNGFRVLRFTNEELFGNIDGVLEKIKEQLFI